MDEAGNWLDRPFAILEHVNDKLELQFSQVDEATKSVLKKTVGSFGEGKDRFEDDDKTNAKIVARDLGSRMKSHTRDINKAKPPFLNFDDLSDLFGSPIKQPEEEAQSAPDSGEDNGESKAEPKDSEAAATCNPSSPSIRPEWSSYSSADRTAFVDAIKCLQDKPSGGSQFTGARNRYEDLISVHRGMTANIHQTAAFLVWHRYFVWVFEQLLRNECGFNRAMPWWDETKHAGAFAASDVFTEQWFGHLPAKTSNGQGTCIESGEFSGTTLHVGPGTSNSDHCLSRAVDESQTAQCNKDFTNSCLSMGSYEEFRDCFELGPHGYGHNGIGAVMAEVSASVGDPVFFMHHLFVDHTFRIWQNANPSRRTTISGCADAANPCTPITLDTKLSSNGIGPDLTVRQAMNTLGGSLCYRYDY
ncbi:Di-copper centre-containing protein [Nemania serpens]|nr:Di-copper centre-containing protein [Nemania serpens]